MTQGEQELTRTFGFKGRLTAIADAGTAFRQALAQVIRNVRSIVGTKYNEGLLNLTRYYKENFPNLIKK
jgi:hypothetical protein